MKKISFLICFVLLLALQNNAIASASYSSGSLLALKAKGSAVYYIGEDGKKYIFPDSKTYFTWYDNFNDVIKVNVDELDKYPNGGSMPYKPNSKLITHQDTNNVYAVEPNGVLRKIVSEEIAKKLYGNNWTSMVQDVIPGYFANTYTLGSDLVDLYPTGILIKGVVGNNIYYVDGKYKRPFYDNNAILANNLDINSAIVVDNLGDYVAGKIIIGQENILSNFFKDKFSNRILSYKMINQTDNSIQVRFIDENFVPIEIKKMVVSGSSPSNVSYNNKSYQFPYYDDVHDNFYEYNQDSVIVKNTSTPIIFSPRGAGGNGWGGVSQLELVLKYWEVWDINENKQIVNFRNQMVDSN